MPAIIGFIFIILFYFLFGVLTPLPNNYYSQLTTFVLPQHNLPLRNQKIAPIKIAAASAVAFDETSNLRLLDQNADEPRPIASLTKLMTALVFLETKPDWQRKIKIIKADLQTGGKANLFINDELTIDDLFKVALIASDNTAITALVRSSGLTEQEFVQKMQAKVGELKIPNLTFTEPTGLATTNQGSAVAVAKLVNLALKQEKIKDTLILKKHSFSVGFKTVREIKSTDELLEETLPENIMMVGGKTGHLNEAGYCFAGVFDLNGHKIMTAILGAPVNDNRFAETIKILNWTKQAYLWNN